MKAQIIAIGLAALSPFAAGAVVYAFQEPTILRYPKIVEVTVPAPEVVCTAEPVTAAPAPRRVVEREPISTAARDRAKAEYTKGLRLFAASHEPEARAAFARALEIDPSFSGPYRALGTLHARAGELGRMCAEFRTYLALTPRAGDAARIRNEIAKYAPTEGACRGAD
jgi:tetratricopeptide (TPR) repeat protein